METTTRSPQAGRPSRDDAALIADSYTDPECFGQLFDRHATTIHGYIARRLGRDAADDLVAETFLVAFGRRQGYDLSRPSARPWLYGIATNLIGRHRRDEVRLLRAIARTGVDSAAEPVADLAARRVAAAAVRRDLAAGLARLPATDRSVLLLITEGLGYQEIAVALGVPAGTVCSRLARARKKLRAALGGSNPASAEMET